MCSQQQYFILNDNKMSHIFIVYSLIKKLILEKKMHYVVV